MSDIFVVKLGSGCADGDVLVGAFSRIEDANKYAHESIVEMIEAWDGDEALTWAKELREEKDAQAMIDQWNAVVYKESLDNSMYVSVVSVLLKPGIKD